MTHKYCISVSGQRESNRNKSTPIEIGKFRTAALLDILGFRGNESNILFQHSNRTIIILISIIKFEQNYSQKSRTRRVTVIER